jgi:hypothetical protein
MWLYGTNLPKSKLFWKKYAGVGDTILISFEKLQYDDSRKLLYEKGLIEIQLAGQEVYVINPADTSDRKLKQIYYDRW